MRTITEPCASVDAPIAFLSIVRYCRRATEHERSA